MNKLRIIALIIMTIIVVVLACIRIPQIKKEAHTCDLENQSVCAYYEFRQNQINR